MTAPILVDVSLLFMLMKKAIVIKYSSQDMGIEDSIEAKTRASSSSCIAWSADLRLVGMFGPLDIVPRGHYTGETILDKTGDDDRISAGGRKHG